MKSIICRTTNLLYIAALCCLLYLIGCWCILTFYFDERAAGRFVVFFTAEYRGFLSGIPILTLFLISSRLLRAVPVTVAKSISYKELAKTDYKTHRKNFSSSIKAVIQSSSYFIGFYAAYSILEFGRSDLENLLLKLFTAAQAFFASYVARKLYHIGRMLESIRHVDVHEDLFLGPVNANSVDVA